MMPTTKKYNSISNIIAFEHSLSTKERLQDLLKSIRYYLNMDVSFISEFTETHRVFRHINTSSEVFKIQEGSTSLLEDSYCVRVTDGRLPGLIHDASQHPEAAKLEVTHNLPVGAHLSVPIILENGEIYGTFCCFSHSPNITLNERDLHMMEAFAHLAAKEIQLHQQQETNNDEIAERINTVLMGDQLQIVYQPIFDVNHNKVVGFEALSRFNTEPVRSPDIWFNEAAKVGMGVKLECKAVKKALQALEILPEHIYIYTSVNVSPHTILSGSVEDLFDNTPLHRVILEVTEHEAIDVYTEISTAISQLRVKGLKLAVDDAGAGYASFRHILSLSPEVIKLDISITRDIDILNAHRALTTAFVYFSIETGSKIVAEGVETTKELEVLRRLGVNYIQGYLLGKPMSIDEAIKLV